ncbi:LLM class F420-dependent oxidoreductase [Mycobacterium sp. Root265]|uniref:LLM class F420-dependent oxidoreductase n=1 Tax=Mycobacterium sp. Root265 TaxID=1736504 RepID=UPI00070DE05C|nr:LLM class F420-dependent oxidoreductase [Mycobacterium sp. Root265]KRD09631.1 LLM class F420-dependent oxidoreductase [Mycobacterium sp. Root265]
MKAGINGTFTDRSTITPADFGRAVEERGFDSIFLAEHTHIPVDEVSPYPFGDRPESPYHTIDPFVALSVIAGSTDHLLLGTGISLVAQRVPITTAKMIASLDLVSNGRVIYGIGTGWNLEEMATHGGDPAKRGAIATEHILAMKEIWNHDKAEFHGRYVDFDPIYSWPKPVQRPHPPVYVGGGEKAFRRVIDAGDAWFPNPASPAGLGPKIQRLRALAGRDLPVTVLHVGPAEAELVAGYAQLDVERIVFPVDTEDPDPLAVLDHLATLTA